MKHREVGDQLFICTERPGHPFSCMTAVRVDISMPNSYYVVNLDPPFQVAIVDRSDLMDPEQLRELVLNNPIYI